MSYTYGLCSKPRALLLAIVQYYLESQYFQVWLFFSGCDTSYMLSFPFVFFKVSSVDFPNFCTVWRVNSYIYLLTFSNIFFNRLFIFSLSHLNIISSFILYSFFNHHLFFLYSFPTTIFFNEKYYIHNIFCNTFTRITTKSYVESYY